jgi:hypothetical protein
MKIKAGALHKLNFVSEFPHTLDLKEKAAQTIILQRAIGDIFAGLAANQVPLELAVSISKGPPDLSTNPCDRYEVTIFWRLLEGDTDIHIFKDLMLAKRCLDCASFMGVNHICNISNPPQNQDPSDEGDGSSETVH